MWNAHDDFACAWDHGLLVKYLCKAMIGDAVQAAAEDAQLTLGADKGYDAQECVDALSEWKVSAHIAQNNTGRRSAVADSVAASDGYSISKRKHKHKRVEQPFGWGKLVGDLRPVKLRGLEKVDQIVMRVMSAYNLTQMRRLGQLRLQNG